MDSLGSQLCTKSSHHSSTSYCYILYLMVPYSKPHVQWCMGACMSVELNTWFLIARRVFNKQGFCPWVIGLPPLFSIRVKLISIFFYLTWISIRCILYPYMLLEVTRVWQQLLGQGGNPIQRYGDCISAASCLLSAQYEVDI